MLGLDEGSSRGPEGAAQHPDREGQIAFLDERLRPHLAQQLLFGDEQSAVAQQDEQDVEGLGRERDARALMTKRPVARIDAERAELVALVVGHGHLPCF